MEILFLLVMYLTDSNNVWSNYFCYGFNSLAYNHTKRYARMLAVFFQKTHQKTTRCGPVCIMQYKYYGKLRKVAVIIVVNNRFFHNSQATSRCCIAASCDNVSGEGYSFHKFPKDNTKQRRWVNAVKQQRSSWNGLSVDSQLCSRPFEDDCFITEGVHFVTK